MLRLLMLLIRLLVFPLLLLEKWIWRLFVRGEKRGGGCREDAGVNCESLIPGKGTNDEGKVSKGQANKLSRSIKSFYYLA
jgi:hypothetical protein